MHEWEARIRHVESYLNDLADAVRKLADQVGQVAQNQRMQHQPTGVGVSVVRIAKVGGTAIPAMGGSTPGSGSITLHDNADAALASGATATAYNLASEEVTANAWILVARVGSKWTVIFEACTS